MPGSAGVSGMFLDGLRINPAGMAFRAGAAEYSYTELHEAALSVAEALDLAGGPARVAILTNTSTAFVASLLGTLYTGAAAVPLNVNFPLERIRQVIEAAGIGVAIVDDRGEQILAGLSAELPGLTSVPATPTGTGEPTLRSHYPRQVEPTDLAYIMFTSGSTGRPKGVPVSHGNLAHFFGIARGSYDLGADDVVAQTFEPTFDLFYCLLFLGWAVGAGVVVTPPSVLHRLPQFAAKHRLSAWLSVPSTIRFARRLGGLSPGSLPTLRYSMFCGEPLSYADAETWMSAASNSALDNLYGPTEATIACTGHRWDPPDRRQSSNGGLVPIGSLHNGLRYLLLDELQQPADLEGELCVHGPQVFAGYLDPADDIGRFHQSDGIRWYRTGDRVRRLASGELTYLGRLDSQVKIRGYRVEPAEIEHVLGELAGVDHCAVVPARHTGEVTLIAYYSGDPEAAPALMSELSRRLPRYMMPDQLLHLPAMPVNQNGKIDRRALLPEQAGASPR